MLKMIKFLNKIFNENYDFLGRRCIIIIIIVLIDKSCCCKSRGGYLGDMGLSKNQTIDMFTSASDIQKSGSSQYT